MNGYCDEIRAHYETVWKSRALVRRWSRGPLHELPGEFVVAEFESVFGDHAWAYGTCGMSRPEDEEPLEIHLFAPFRDDSHVELLTVICHYHRTGCRLGLGHTVNLGRPWLPGSTCSFGLISLPYLHGPALENYRNGISNKTVRFLWLIPITHREREYKKEKGLEVLEAHFEKAAVNYLDPARDSVV
jgi:hypothetical protein